MIYTWIYLLVYSNWKTSKLLLVGFWIEHFPGSPTGIAQVYLWKYWCWSGVVGRENTTGSTPSPSRWSRTGNLHKSHNWWYTGQSILTPSFLILTPKMSQEAQDVCGCNWTNVSFLYPLSVIQLAIGNHGKELVSEVVQGWLGEASVGARFNRSGDMT